MIDYEKLKIAHESAKKLSFEDWEIKHVHSSSYSYLVLTFTDSKGLWWEECFEDIDELIVRINELTHPKPKNNAETGYISEILDQVHPENGILSLEAGDYQIKNGLVYKVTRLTHPKPKYKVGQKVWYIDLPVNVIHSAKIIRVRDDEYQIDGSTNGTKDDFDENELYPTKQSLIESQITYWSSLLENEEIYIPEEVQNGQVEYKIDCNQSSSPKSACCSVHAGTEEECQHECKWDGILVSKSPNMGRCRICKQMCYVALDHDKWLKGECEATPIIECKQECEHESDGSCYYKNGIKCTDFLVYASHDSPCYLKCNKCGEFYR